MFFAFYLFKCIFYRPQVQAIITLLEKFGRISLYVTADAITKLYGA